MGPRMRARAEADWFTPSTSPCFVGSLRRDISDCTDGVSKAKPVTVMVRTGKAESHEEGADPQEFHFADLVHQPAIDKALGDHEDEADIGKDEEALLSRRPQRLLAQLYVRVGAGIEEQLVHEGER